MANNSVNSSMTRSDVARSENFSRAYIMPATHFSVHGNENAVPGLDFNFALQDKARIQRAIDTRNRFLARDTHYMLLIKIETGNV